MTVDYAILYSIGAIGALFWIFPAIKQYKTELFWYFFVLAISDPIVISLWFWLHKIIGVDHIYPFLLFFMLLALYWSRRKSWYVRTMLSALLLIHIITFSSSTKIHYGVMFLFHLPILSFFLKRSIYCVAETGIVNLFHLTLILYEISIIMKILAIMTNADTGAAFYYVTDIFQILIAVFFSIFREDDKRLIINLRNV